MENYADLSGFDDWDWGDGRMNFEGFEIFVNKNYDEEPYASIVNEDDKITALLAGYCVQEGGNLGDWAIRENGDVERAAETYGLASPINTDRSTPTPSNTEIAASRDLWDEYYNTSALPENEFYALTYADRIEMLNRDYPDA